MIEKSMKPIIFSAQMKYLRKTKRITLRELSKKTEIKVERLSAIENDVTIITLEEQEKIMKVLGV